MIAAFVAGAWRYVAPTDGMRLLERATGSMAMFRDGAWEIGEVRGERLVLGGEQVVGPRVNAIADPAGGTEVDTEARAAIGAILAALRQHGLIAG